MMFWQACTRPSRAAHHTIEWTVPGFVCCMCIHLVTAMFCSTAAICVLGSSIALIPMAHKPQSMRCKHMKINTRIGWARLAKKLYFSIVSFCSSCRSAGGAQSVLGGAHRLHHMHNEKVFAMFRHLLYTCLLKLDAASVLLFTHQAHQMYRDL